jgi:imidazolonepropionase-like amidohydrolase
MRRASTSFLLLGFLSASSAHAQDLVLTNAKIVDPSSRTVVDGSLWIRNGRIAGRGATVPAGTPGERIDVQGRWIIPGLVDLHTHSFGNIAPGGVVDASGTQGTAMRVLRAGVTAFLDLFNAEDVVLKLRDRQRAGGIGGAEIFAAGPCFTATKGHCSEYGTPTRLIDSPDDARRQLAQLAPKHPDFIKVVYDHNSYGGVGMPTIDRATLAALIAAGKERGLRTIVHVGTWNDARDAVEAGAAAVTHVPQDGAVPADVVTLMAQRRTWHIPTLVVHTDLAELLDHPELIESPLLKALTSDTLRAAYRRGAGALDVRTQRRLDAQRAATPVTLESVRQLHAAGVRMLVGTDAGNPGTFQGYSVHRELIRLVQAGLSTWEALAAATTDAGAFLERKFGVRAGDAANLVVLDASPIDDIANTQRIAIVVARGQVVYRLP